MGKEKLKIHVKRRIGGWRTTQNTVIRTFTKFDNVLPNHDQ